MNKTLEQAVKVTQKYAGKSLIVLKKYSPEILVVGGIVGGITAAVMGAKAAMRSEPVVEMLETRVKDAKELRKTMTVKDYSQADYARDLAEAYTKASLDFGRLYGPSLAVGTASIACILGAHGIMRKRNAGLLLAYNAVEKAFTAYRARVIEEFGEDKDQDYRLGLRNEVVTGENGKEKINTTLDRKPGSRYARLFAEETSKVWSVDPNMNFLAIKNVQMNMNDRLHTRGHVFLNEVWDALGMEREADGQLVGWSLRGDGDHAIDLGVFNAKNTRARLFLDGIEDSVWLDPNVDGAIIDKI